MQFIKDFLRNIVLLVLLGLTLFVLSPDLMGQVFHAYGVIFGPLAILIILVIALPRRRKTRRPSKTRKRMSAREGEMLFWAIFIASYHAYQEAIRHPLFASLTFGFAAASVVIAILLLARSRRLRRANLLARDSLYKDLSPIEFEHATAEIFRSLGFKAKVTPPSGDEGLDIILERNGTTIGVQCKRYKNNIGPGPIREFSGSLSAAGLKQGFFVTTSGFTRAAVQAAEKSDAKIRLISGEEIGRLRNLAEKRVNTDLIPKPWWGSMHLWQKGVLIALFYICVVSIVGTASYILLTM